MRVGTGFDLHRTGGEGPLILGGVEIPGASGLVGHSDADCVLHALADALLGAAGLGDIGEHFPDDDPSRAPVNHWRAHANVLFSNWINELYRSTSFELEGIPAPRPLRQVG